MLYSLQVVRCLEVDSEEVSPETSHAGLNSIKSGEKTGNVRLVMFPVNQSEQMNLQIGTRIRIHPPWYVFSVAK